MSTGNLTDRQRTLVADEVWSPIKSGRQLSPVADEGWRNNLAPLSRNRVIGQNGGMILIGTMNLTTTRDRGDFHCPTCAATQSYRLRVRRPWLTIYFIPTVPVGAAEPFVHCDQCRSTWDLTVLEMDQQSHEMAQESQFREEALRSSVLIVIADGAITDAEIKSLETIGSHLLERPVDREELGQLCSIAQQNQIEAGNYVLTVSRRWSQSQRSTALQAMFLAATADEMGETQTKLLARMRDTLELTDLEFEQAIEQALLWEGV